MSRKHNTMAFVLALCLLISFAALPSAAESAESGGMFFSGYRWLSAYTALFSSPQMNQCVGLTTEKGLVWAVSRANGCLQVLYADQDGNGWEAYVEESRTSRTTRDDIAKWLSDTGKEQIEVKQQSLAPLAVSKLADGGTPAPVKEPADSGPEISKQPEDQSVRAGEEVTFAVSAPDASAFQWKYSKDGGKTWDDLRNQAFWNGCKKDTLRFTAEEKHGSLLFRCVVSDKAGSRESQTARLIIASKIVPLDEKPADCTAGPGDEVSFHASLEGAEKYHWQYSKDDGTVWGDLTNGEFWQGNKTDTLTFKADAKHNGFLFRCAAVYQGESVCSDAALLTVRDYSDVLPEVHAQTGDLVVHEGEEVTLSVEAEYASSYQWQYSRDYGKTWANFKNSKVWNGNEGATLTFRASLSQDEMLFRCAVTNPAGTVESKPIQLSVLFK